MKLEYEKGNLCGSVEQALQRGEFKAYLQFVVDAKTEQICGCEMLSRWQHPDKGLLYPGEYIAGIEQTDLIIDHDFYIFEQACKNMKKWESDGYEPLWFSGNFTRKTIDTEGFVDRLEEIVSKYGFDRKKFHVEITEDAVERDKELAKKNMRECKSRGFTIALDDFGKGHSSVFDLRDYPIDKMKLDMEILEELDNPDTVALIRGLIQLAHCMGKTVICEGISNREQAQLLREAGCDYFQGFYYSKVYSLEEAEEVYKERCGNKMSHHPN